MSAIMIANTMNWRLTARRLCGMGEYGRASHAARKSCGVAGLPLSGGRSVATERRRLAAANCSPNDSRLKRRRLLLTTTRNAEAIEDQAGRIGTVEGIEMDPGDIVIQLVVALIQREVDAHPADHFRVVFAAL